MTLNLWRVVLGLVIAAHGIGHMFFLVPTLGLAQWGFAGRSWLLSGNVPDTLIKIVGSILWVLAIAGFVAAAGGLWSQQAWWRGIAMASSIVSLLGLALFVQPTQPFVSAAVLDIVILVALILRWPPVDLVGA
ncbi:MAG: hypothetical protein GX597_14710 [Anaerolineaceae bacterium]|nr:hypothetical protein [Anaerolineaceae bacterium]